MGTLIPFRTPRDVSSLKAPEQDKLGELNYSLSDCDMLGLRGQRALRAIIGVSLVEQPIADRRWERIRAGGPILEAADFSRVRASDLTRIGLCGKGTVDQIIRWLAENKTTLAPEQSKAAGPSPLPPKDPEGAS